MAVAPVKSNVMNIRNRNLIKLPMAVIEEQGITKGVPVNVTYGKNYTAVVILPNNLKVNERMLERISILVNEPLT